MKSQRDFEAGAPKVKLGGWIGGHDYGQPRKIWGVKKAVDRWAAKQELTVERDQDMTWFVWLRRSDHCPTATAATLLSR